MATRLSPGSPARAVPDEFKGSFREMAAPTAALARAAFINFVIDCLGRRSVPERQLVGIVRRKWRVSHRCAEHRLKNFLERGWLPATRTEEDGAFVWRYRRP